MAEDFKASQVQTNKVIATGSFAGGSANQVLVYPITAEDSGSPNQGAIDSAVFDTSAVGSDVLLFVSGGIGERGTADAGSVSVFGGDLHISGNLTIDGSGGGGGGAPVGAEYVVISTDATLTNERALAAGTGISIVDAGAGSTVTISATGGSGATSGTFNVPSPSEFVTTASVSIAGGEGFAYTADSVGTDTYFFVSGSQGSKDGATAGVSVFGGDTVVSGNLTSIGNFEVGEISETLGTDVGMFVSGIIGSKDGSQAGTALFGGDVHISGNLTVEGAGAAGSTGKQYVAPYTSFSTTSTTAAGQFSWFPADFSGLTSVTVRAVMSTDGTTNLTGSLQMFNFTSGTYVDLVDTPATSKHMIITASTPTAVTSSNLLTGETAFGNLVDSVYEIRVSGSSANQVVLGGVELVFS